MTNLDDATKVGNTINSWGKIVIVIGGAVVSCAFAYYMLLSHEREIQQIKKEHSEAMILIEERAEKRYSRAIEKAKTMEEFGLYHEKRLLELEKDNAYNKGLIDGLKLKK